LLSVDRQTTEVNFKGLFMRLSSSAPLSCRPGTTFSVLAAILYFAAQSSSSAESPVNLINAEARAGNIVITPVRDSISMLSGSGGNITVLHGTQGKLMVDGGITLSRAPLQAALNQLGSDKPKYVINTHWHWDHADSNGWLHELGATVVAHPNSLKHMSESVRVEDWQHTFEPVSKNARPTSLVSTTRTIELNGEKVLLKYYGPAHTDGDLYVYFESADVLATGDTYWNGVYPFIDGVAGGSIDGMIAAAETNIARSTEDTIIVPGHGPLAKRADLIEYRDMLVEIRRNVAVLKKQGKTLDQVIAARPTAKFDPKWGNFVINPAFFTKLVYRGV
jgi:glyoxylase-like metal-dependent hydrolase (beta-lactamase superfamily II)